MAIDPKSLPPQIQNQLGQLQQIQQQLQLVTQQRTQIDLRLKDTERALEELKKTTEKTPIYKSIGSLLIRAPNKQSIKKELTENKETLEIRKKTLEQQEGRFKEKSQELQSKIQNALSLSKAG
jgi:prefoldin beta subunit